MSAIRKQFQIVDDLEGGSAFALFLSAAGYAVETDFLDGSVFISADAVDLEIDGAELQPQVLLPQIYERLNDPPEEIECAELSSEFHNVA